MMYIMDKYGNKIVLNSTFEIVGLPFQREYSTAQIPGSDGEIQTTEPVVASGNRSIAGRLVEPTLEEARAKRNELADICGRGLIRVGHEEEGWYVEGQCISFDHKYSTKTGRCVADVSFTLKCDDPHQKADEVIEELIITPSDYPEKIEMLNPHPSANVRFGTFDVDTGAKISDESNWIINPAAIYTQGIGHGFTFDCYRGFSLSAYAGSGVREFKVFVDGVFREEVTYSGTSEFAIRYSTNFNDSHKHEVTIFLTQVTLYVDYIYLNPANLPVLQNPGTVADYPVLEVEPADTEALFSPLGKKVGDVVHPFSMNHIYSSDPLANITPDSTGITPTQTYYDKMAFLDGDLFGVSRVAAGQYSCLRCKIDFKSLQSAYSSMTATEIKDHMQSILSELWGYARGAIEVGDPSFESGVNGFTPNGAALEQSSEWAKSGANSLKIVTDASTHWAHARKSYVNQAGKKLTAKATFYNPLGGATVALQWYDYTNAEFIAGTATYVMSPAEEKTLELEVIVPENCTNIRLYLRPSYGLAEAHTVYVDNVTVTAHGLEMYVYNGIEWVLAAQTGADYPWKMAWNITSGFGIQDDGKICFLLKAKYPSDGISSSVVYIDHCRLGTKMNYAKLGADAITNYGGNLLPAFTDPAWDIHSNARVLGDYELELNADEQLQNSRRELDALPSTEYYLQVHSGAYMVQYYDANGVNLAGQGVPSSGSLVHNRKFLTPPECVRIRIGCYNIEAGRFLFKNPMLTQTSEGKPFNPQDLRMLEFSEDIVLSKGDLITVDTKRREADKNGERLYQLINQSFKFFPLQIFGGQNHFRINHSGANLKIRLKYQPKWR